MALRSGRQFVETHSTWKSACILYCLKSNRTRHLKDPSVRRYVWLDVAHLVRSTVSREFYVTSILKMNLAPKKGASRPSSRWPSSRRSVGAHNPKHQQRSHRSSVFLNFYHTKSPTPPCLAKEKEREAAARRRAPPHRPRPDFSSPSVVSVVICVKERYDVTTTCLQ